LSPGRTAEVDEAHFPDVPAFLRRLTKFERPAPNLAYTRGRSSTEVKLPGNMQNIMRQAQQMQQRLQEEIAQIRVEASAGGGMVSITMDGHKNVLACKIDPEVAGDVEMIQDMVVAACNEAVKKVDDTSKEKMGGMLAGLGLPPGMF
jgi:nucleoid-associated protein EbfC